LILEHTQRERKKKERYVKARQTDDRRGQQQGKLEMEAEKSKKRRYKHRVAQATAGRAGLHGLTKKVARINVIEQSIKL